MANQIGALTNQLGIFFCALVGPPKDYGNFPCTCPLTFTPTLTVPESSITLIVSLINYSSTHAPLTGPPDFPLTLTVSEIMTVNTDEWEFNLEWEVPPEYCDLDYTFTPLQPIGQCTTNCTTECRRFRVGPGPLTFTVTAQNCGGTQNGTESGPLLVCLECKYKLAMYNSTVEQSWANMLTIIIQVDHGCKIYIMECRSSHYPARVCAGGVKRLLLSVHLCVCASVCLSVTKQRCRDIRRVKQLLYLTETHSRQSILACVCWISSTRPFAGVRDLKVSGIDAIFYRA